MTAIRRSFELIIGSLLMTNDIGRAQADLFQASDEYLYSGAKPPSYAKLSLFIVLYKICAFKCDVLKLARIRCGKTDRCPAINRTARIARFRNKMADQKLERTMGKRYQVGHIELTRDELLGRPGPGFTITEGDKAVVTFIYSDATDAEAAHTLITQAVTKAASIVAAYL